MPTVLPRGFEELEEFVAGWALPTGTARNRKRLSSSMDEIEAFYHAVRRRQDEIIRHLDAGPLAEMPGEARPLFYLLLSLAEVAPAVEFFKHPAVVDGFDSARFVAVGEAPD